MKLIALLLLVAGSAIPFEREGNYSIRFEPMAVLQCSAPVPFHIKVDDDRNKPVNNATVTLQISTKDHEQVHTYKATGIGAGIYSAKPVFPEAGEWLVLVDVHRDDQVSARTITFEVSKPQS